KHDEVLSISQNRERERGQVLAEVRARQTERDQALAEIEARQREIAALKASTSWRLTAPVRAVKGGPVAMYQLARSAARKLRAAIRKQLNPKSYADPAQAAKEDAARLLARSSLFDPKWYLVTYPDIRDAGVDPLEHYLLYGGFEGRAPGP